jgi:hypothetical protein
MPFEVKSYVKCMAQCKNKENVRVKIERFAGKQILSEKLNWRGYNRQGIHKKWLILNTQKDNGLET